MLRVRRGSTSFTKTSFTLDAGCTGAMTSPCFTLPNASPQRSRRLRHATKLATKIAVVAWRRLVLVSPKVEPTRHAATMKQQCTVQKNATHTVGGQIETFPKHHTNWRRPTRRRRTQRKDSPLFLFLLLGSIHMFVRTLGPAIHQSPTNSPAQIQTTQSVNPYANLVFYLEIILRPLLVETAAAMPDTTAPTPTPTKNTPQPLAPCFPTEPEPAAA